MASANVSLPQYSTPPSVTEDEKESGNASNEADSQTKISTEITTPQAIPKTDTATQNAESNNAHADEQNEKEWVWSWRAFFSQSDTVAQWIMAGLGAVATLVSIWAVLLLKATLRATKETLDQAKETTDETKHMTAIARTDVRPWVTMERDTLSHLSVIKTAQGPKGNARCTFVVRYRLKNYGKTPGHSVTVHCKLLPSGEPFGQARDFQDFVEKHRSAAIENKGRTIFPNETIDMRFFEGHDWFDFDWDKEPKLWLLFVIRYRTSGSDYWNLEARYLCFEPIRNSCGPFGHQLLEFTAYRITE